MQKADDGLASRVTEIRREVFGDHDESVAALAGAIGILAATWENYERGVKIPALVLLHFLVCTGVEPQWLLTGQGERYRVRPVDNGRHGPG